MAIRVGATQRRVGLAALPGYRQNVRDTTGEALGEVGQGIARLGQGAAAVARKIVEEQDNAAIQLATAELSASKRAMLDGERDDSTGELRHGLAQQQGQDALKNSKGFSDNWRTEVDRVRGKLTPRQQEKAFGIFHRETEDFEDSVNRHVARQTEELRKQGYAAALQSAKSDVIAAAARGEHDKVQSAIMKGLAHIGEQARVEGWEKGFGAQQVRTFETEAHLGVLEQLIGKGDNAGAREYLATARRYMDGEMLAKSKIEKILDAGLKNDSARALADEAWEAAKGDPLEAQQRLRDKGITDTDVFDEAMQRVTQRGSAEAAARRQADAEPLGALEQIVLSGGAFTKTHPKFVNLSEQGKADALRMLKAERNRRNESGAAARREQLERDRYALALFDGLDLVGDAGSDKQSIDIEALARSTNASPTALEGIRARQKAAQTKVAKDGGVSAQEYGRQVDAAIQEAGVHAASNKAKKLRQLLNAKHAAYEDPKHPGAPPPPEMVKKWIVEGMAYDDGGWLGRGSYAIEREGEKPKAEAPTPQAKTREDGAVLVTNGKRTAWLKPGATMPEGWSRAQ